MKKENLAVKADDIWSTTWVYIRTVIDTAREPFLILDDEFRIIAANSCFMRTFEVGEKEVDGKIVYDLGNGQWDIPKLRSLLEDILPKDTYFKDFEVDHIFPTIGRKIILLNARRIFHTTDKSFPPLILLAMEDVTDRRMVSEKLAEYAQKVEANIDSKMSDLSGKVDELERLYKVISDRDAQITELRERLIELKKRLDK